MYPSLSYIYIHCPNMGNRCLCQARSQGESGSRSARHVTGPALGDGSDRVYMGLQGGNSWSFTGWWFGTFFIFPYIGNHHPN